MHLLNGNINSHNNPLKRYYYYHSHFTEGEPEDAGAGQWQSWDASLVLFILLP